MQFFSLAMKKLQQKGEVKMTFSKCIWSYMFDVNYLDRLIDKQRKISQRIA